MPPYTNHIRGLVSSYPTKHRRIVDTDKRECFIASFMLISGF
jgi:hypothetical protein